MNTCCEGENESDLPVARHPMATITAASAKRYATDTSGATTPSWYLMPSQVEPQINVAMANSAALLGVRSEDMGRSGHAHSGRAGSGAGAF